jgi:hypothetical protein
MKAKPKAGTSKAAVMVGKAWTSGNGEARKNPGARLGTQRALRRGVVSMRWSHPTRTVTVASYSIDH